MTKTAAQLDKEIAIYLDRNRGARHASKRLLVILDERDDGQAIGRATVAQLREFAERGTINGSKHNFSIAERYFDKHDNDVAESLTQAEVRKIIQTIEEA